MTEKQLQKGNECMRRANEIRSDFAMVTQLPTDVFHTIAFAEFFKTMVVAAEHIKDAELQKVKEQLEAI